MPSTTRSNTRRRGDLAMIHIAAKHLFGDVSKGGDGREAYEDWLEVKTGKRSAARLTTPERIALIKVLRKDGLIPDRHPGGIGQTAAGEDRPTKEQWARIGTLARQMGWHLGLDDHQLHGFIKRTAKVSNARFMSRRQASSVITGLENWQRQRHAAKRAGGTDAMS